MSTDLSVLKAESFLALREGGMVTLREAQEASGETVGLGALTWIRTPSGGLTSWEVDDGLGNIETVREITGVVVLYRKRSILWPTEGEATEGTRPLLVSDDHPDLSIARKVGDDYGDLDPEIIEGARREDGLYDIRPVSRGGSFLYTEFGSSGKGPGARMKEQRIIGILRPGDLWPVMLTVQPGSLTDVKNTFARLSVPYWRAIAKLTLVKATSVSGVGYSKLAVSFSRETLSPEQGEQVKAAYTLPLTQAILAGQVAAVE